VGIAQAVPAIADAGLETTGAFVQRYESTCRGGRSVGRSWVVLAALLLTLGGQLVVAAQASAAPAQIFVQQVGGNGDAVQITALAAARDVPTYYWVEFGRTTDYGQRTDAMVLPAGPDQQVVFTIRGLARGEYHARLVGDTDPNATATGGFDFTFNAPGIFFSVTSTRPTGDGVGISARIAGRSVDTEYWVEFGSTTAYGQETAHRLVPADSVPVGEQRDIYFLVSGMPAGGFHVRLVAQSPGMAEADRGQDFTFTTVPGQSGVWPDCSSARPTQCVQSFTVDGQTPFGVHAEVSMMGGGLQMQAISDRGTQELLYPGSPVSATSTVTIVVNAGDYDTGVIVADGYVSTARVEATDAGNVITFAASPQRTSFLRSGCTIGACGDDTTRGDDDYAGRVVAAAFPPSPDTAYAAASRGLWMSSNAQSSSTPWYDASSQSLVVQLAAPHLTAAGDLNDGFFQAFLPTRMFTDLWHVDGPGQVEAQVSDDGTEQAANHTWTEVAGGWLFTLQGFHYSSPTIRFTPVQNSGTDSQGGSAGGSDGSSSASSPSTAPSATPTASASPTPSPTATPSQLPASTLPCLGVHVATPTIDATGVSSVSVTGARPGDSIQIQGYSQNHDGTASFANDPTPVDAGEGSARGQRLLADESGSLIFSGFRPASNTRYRARVVGGDYCGATAVQSVAAHQSLNVVRRGVRTYTFSGISLPARPGGLIVSLYVVRGTTEVLVAQARASVGLSDGSRATYAMTLTFSSRYAARETFVVKTGRDAQNVAGRSNLRTVAIF
jgi:hypothetical protein